MNFLQFNPRIAVVAILMVALATRAAAQDAKPNAPIRSSPAHERLGVFEGEWRSIAPGVEPASRDACSWLPGARRHMICRRVTESARGAIEQMMIYSYRRSDSAYTVTVLLPAGQVWTYAGRPEGDQWIFYLDKPQLGDGQRLRQVIKSSADTLHFVEEVSENGSPWRLTDASEDYSYVRIASPPP